MAKRDFIPNQVFVGLPFKDFKEKYDRCIAKLRQKSPVSLVIVGNDGSQRAEDLLELIKRNLYASSEAIFDVTGGNPNVALEFGLAHAKEIPSVVYLSRHKAHSKKTSTPIIADLSGIRRREYKNETGIHALLRDFCDQHPFSKRVEITLKKNSTGRTLGQKNRQRALWLKAIHSLDQVETMRRENIKQSLLGEAYSDEEVEKALKVLHATKLIHVSRGRHSEVTIT